MSAFHTLAGDQYIHEPGVISALDQALQYAQEPGLDSVLRAVTALPDTGSRCELTMIYQLYGWCEAQESQPNRELGDQAQELTWLLRLIWAGLLHTEAADDWSFRALAAAALERLPQNASHNDAWVVLSDWLAEVQPAAILQCRADLAVWFEEYLTDPRQSFRLTDTDPNAALAALQVGELLPNTPQIHELLGRFLFDWVDEHRCMWNIPSYRSIVRHLLRQLVAQSVTV